jgi:hypothetical protein
MSLRRPNDFKGLRYCNINVGTNERPIWNIVKENIQDKEKIRKPQSTLGKRDVRTISKNDYMKDMVDFNNIFDEINDLEVLGDNLFDQEIKKANDLKDKVLYKESKKNLLENEFIKEDLNKEKKNYHSKQCKLRNKSANFIYKK